VANWFIHIYVEALYENLNELKAFRLKLYNDYRISYYNKRVITYSYKMKL